MLAFGGTFSAVPKTGLLDKYSKYSDAKSFVQDNISTTTVKLCQKTFII